MKLTKYSWYLIFSILIGVFSAYLYKYLDTYQVLPIIGTPGDSNYKNYNEGIYFVGEAIGYILFSLCIMGLFEKLKLSKLDKTIALIFQGIVIYHFIDVINLHNINDWQ